jgi:hypothetical protein
MSVKELSSVLEPLLAHFAALLLHHQTLPLLQSQLGKKRTELLAWEEPEAIFQQDLEISAPSQFEKGSMHSETVVTTTTIPQNTINNQAAGHSNVQGVDRIAAHATEKEVGQSNLQFTGKSQGRKSPITTLCFVFTGGMGG